MVDALRSFNNNDSPGYDGLTKDFYEEFWSELKEPFMKFISQTKISKKLVTSQRQAVIKLTEKKDKDKRFNKVGDLYHYQMQTKNYSKRFFCQT